MAELNSNEESHVLPPKRKQTLQTLGDEESTKKLRPDNEPPAAVEEKASNENVEKGEIEDEEEEEDYEGEDEVDSDDEDDVDVDVDEDEDEDEVEHSNGGGEIDRKGKGIMKDDKGKGKLIEESEDDDDDSSDDEDGGGGESDGDDDFSDDPLAEVDLDNILPSRTRRGAAPKGVRISGDEVANDKENDA
ncbi:hypothetical protein SSX86_018824 [Deinandra increscens subsp. villosa]|uniref:Histone chaperone domain-containing protein n=1 Tax=Deinandra increscens subsp. villosa TaxID=3103831 RepID=A0AAP0CWM8_9ASTR